MPRQKLTKRLSVTAAPGGSVIMPHGLVDSAGRGVIPHRVMPSGPTNIGCTTADATNCVFTLSEAALAEETHVFEVTAWHTIEAVVANASTNQVLWAPQDGNAILASVPRLNVTAEVVVYINSATGDDDNDGLTSDTPLATLSGWMKKFANFVVHPGAMVVSLADSMNQYWDTASPDLTATPLDYEADALFINGVPSDWYTSSVAIRGPNMVFSAQAAVPSATVASAASTTVNGDRTTVTGTGAGLWAGTTGDFLRIDDTATGKKLFYEAPIITEGVTTVSVANKLWKAVIDTALGVGGNVVRARIMRPGARIVATAAFTPITIGGTGGGGFYAAFEGVGFGDSVVALPSTQLVFDRCRFESYLWAMGSVGFVNVVNVDGVIHEGRPSELPIPRDAVASDPANTAREYETELAITAGSLRVGYDAQAGYAAYRNINVSNSGGNGITVGVGSQFVVDDGVSGEATSIQGAGNAGVGIMVMANGVVRVNNPTTAGKCTITGTGGSLKVSTGAAVAYGTGAGQFSEAAGFNGNFTRVREGASAAAPTGDASIIMIRTIVS